MESPVAEPKKSIVQYRDLREWLKAIEEMGELKHVGGVNWDREMCAMVDMVYRARGSGKAPALLFDEVPGYPAGYRCLYGMMASPRRFAFTIGGIDVTKARSSIEYLKQYRQRMKDIQFIPPVYVDRSPLYENVMEGDDIDLFKFPVPIHHELDGGRYIGTACGVITRDPDSNWINVGTYRIQAADSKSAMCYISPGKHGRLHRDKYFERGQNCPAVAVVGIDPMLFLAGRYQVPPGSSELDWVGGMRGEAVEVLKGKYTDLPIPTNSEIVLEGEFCHDERRLEGPFGEWPGYYAGGKIEEPLFRIKRVLYRNRADPDVRRFHEAAALASLRAGVHALSGFVGWAREGCRSGDCGRLGARSRVRAHLQRGQHQATVFRTCPAGRNSGEPDGSRRVWKPLDDRGGQRY